MPPSAHTVSPRPELDPSSESTLVSRVLGRELRESLSNEGIVLPDERQVAEYLAIHDSLAGMLPAIGAKVRNSVGPDAELSLELRHDPEFVDRQLTLYVRKRRYEGDFLEQLHSLNDEFNGRLEQISGDFLVATDFAAPRGSHAL
jgi:hypothetical protein